MRMCFYGDGLLGMILEHKQHYANFVNFAALFGADCTIRYGDSVEHSSIVSDRPFRHFSREPQNLEAGDSHAKRSRFLQVKVN